MHLLPDSPNQGKLFMEFQGIPYALRDDSYLYFFFKECSAHQAYIFITLILKICIRILSKAFFMICKEHQLMVLIFYSKGKKLIYLYR